MHRIQWRHRLPALLLAAVGTAGGVMSYRLGLWTGGSPDAGLMPFAASLLLVGFAAASALMPVMPLPATVASRLGGYVGAGVILSVVPASLGSLAAFTLAMWFALRFGEGLSARRSAVVGLAMAAATLLLFRVGLGVPLPDPLLDRLAGF